jgi:hypothetical protein
LEGLVIHKHLGSWHGARMGHDGTRRRYHQLSKAKVSDCEL